MKLWQHQQDAIKASIEKPFMLLYAGMGTGKTAIAMHRLAPLEGRRLIITPKPAIGVYAEDNRDFDLDLPIVTLDHGTSKSKAKILDQYDNAIFVVNYETAKLLPLDKYLFSGVVLDECHKIKNWQGVASNNLTRMLKDTPIKLIMSGTPYHDGYEDLYALIRFLKPLINPKRKYVQSEVFGSWYDFLGMYCHTHELRPGVHIIRGYKNVPALQQKISAFTHMIKTEDVVDTPPLVQRTYKAELTGELRDKYNQLRDDNIMVINDDLTSIVPSELTKLLRLMQLSTSGVYRDEYGQDHVLKGLDNRIEILKELLTTLKGQPVIIFTMFKRDIALIKDIALSLGHSDIAYLTGDSDTHEQWKQGSHEILAANLAAGSDGVRLQRAQHAIYWSLGYSRAQFEQSIHRFKRTTSKHNTVYAHYIVSKDTVDVTIYATLTNKHKRIDDLDKLLE